jgi:hypothetical protein
VVGVHHTLPRLSEHVEVLRVAVTFEKDQVVRVDGADGFVEAPLRFRII